jgi:hypothetical protein
MVLATVKGLRAAAAFSKSASDKKGRRSYKRKESALSSAL